MDTPTDAHVPSDAELITSVRAGDETAYGVLYERHAAAARAAARGLTSQPSDADDLVSEAFARVLSALQRGGGPEVAFRPYLLTSVRNAFYDRTRKDKRVDVRDEVPEVVNLGAVDHERASEDAKLAAAAFASLPERWQTVLWYTEVEGRSPAEVAPMLGLAPNAVAALSYRAREGLRQAYLQAHLQVPPPDRCTETVGMLGAYVRDGLSTRDRRKADEHLKGCKRCRALLAELEETSSTLRGALVPLLVGVPAALYLKELGVGASGAPWWRPRSPKQLAVASAAGVAVAGLVVAGALALGRGEPQTVVAGAGGSSTTAPAPTRPGPAGGVLLGPGGTLPLPGPTSLVTAAPTGLPEAPPTGTAPPAATSGATATPTVRPTTAPARNATASARATVSPTVTTRPTTTVRVTTTTRPATTASTAPTTTKPAAALGAALAVVGPVYAGQNASLAAAVTNTGGTASSPVLLVDLPGGTSFPTSTARLGQAALVVPRQLPSGWSCAPAAQVLRCTLPVLAGGASTQAVLPVAIAPDATGSVSFGWSIADGAGPAVTGRSATYTIEPPGPVEWITVDRGAVTLAGNTLLTCVDDDACRRAQDGTATGNNLDNDAYVMRRVDVDGAAGLTASSRATLVLPAGAEVLRAELVWGGDVEEGIGGTSADPTRLGDAVLTGPSGPAAVTGVTVRTATTGVYQAQADVTAAVRAQGAGGWTLSGVQVATGKGRSGGWSLVVAYRDPAATRRLLVLFDALGGLGSSQQAFTATVRGLPAAPDARSAMLGLVAYDGDRGTGNDELRLNGADVVDAANPAGNAYNSTVTGPGVRVPTYLNQLGYDADLIGSALPAGATEAVLSAASSGAGVTLGIAWLAVDVP